MLDRGCTFCHGVVPRGGRPPAALFDTAALRDPAAIAVRVWRHAGTMLDAMRTAGYAWPTLSEADMSDLLAYLSGLAEPAGATAPAPIAADEAEGQAAPFCFACHSNAPGASSGAISLPPYESFAAFLADLWNHAPAMSSRADDALHPSRPLSRADVLDVASDLARPPAQPSTGSGRRGRRFLRTARCIACHIQQLSTAAASTGRGEALSPARLAAVAWYHSQLALPASTQLTARRGPSPAEVAHLLAHLKTARKPESP